ncbi:MAG: Rieske 2Fe-2S domain-containing protein [Myxococcales bacterium]|nr:Rieske 2Fe-2S domain-containing protein [Myxococcales bacterium]
MDLVPGATHSVKISDGNFGMPRSAFVLRLEDGTLRAYVNLCMHLPVPIDAGRGRYFDREGKHLLCRTHGAKYRPDDGYCVEGPCRGMSLERITVVEEGDDVWVLEPDRLRKDAKPGPGHA